MHRNQAGFRKIEVLAAAVGTLSPFGWHAYDEGMSSNINGAYIGPGMNPRRPSHRLSRLKSALTALMIGSAVIGLFMAALVVGSILAALLLIALVIAVLVFWIKYIFRSPRRHN
jgi:hypothetical protein